MDGERLLASEHANDIVVSAACWQMRDNLAGVKRSPRTLSKLNIGTSRMSSGAQVLPHKVRYLDGGAMSQASALDGPVSSPNQLGYRRSGKGIDYRLKYPGIYQRDLLRRSQLFVS